MWNPAGFDKERRPVLQGGRWGIHPSPAFSCFRGLRGLVFLVLAGWLAAGVQGVAAQAPPPDARWLTFDTPHFQVVFHQGVEEVARRAADRAERALEALSGFGERPALPIQLVVTDHADLSNGFASPAPYPRVTIWARPPLDGPQAIPFDDWLEVVVTHEIVHILHLEMTGWLGRGARRLLGRPPFAWPFFPGFTLSRWAVEGVAVHGESALTDGGRGHGIHPEAVVRAAALEGGVERLDQMMGNTPAWPGGTRPYVYGGLFHEWLAREYGEASLDAYFRRQAGRLNPYRIDATAREVFGSSLGDLHGRWAGEMEADARARAGVARERDVAPEPELLTRGARFALYPAFHPGNGRLAFARADGRSEAALVVVEETETLVNAGPTFGRHHFLHGTAPPSWGPDGTLWIPQLEFVGRYRIRGELWRVAEDGVRERVTREGRIVAVDMHPEGDRLVAVQEVPGTNRLVLLSPEGEVEAELTSPDPGVHWAHPRWASDGSGFAVVRWRSGGWWSVVVMGSGGDEVAVLDESRAPITGPAWGPGGETLLWSSERTGARNLFGSRREGEGSGFGPVRQITDLVTAASFPAVSPDGREVVFSLLTGTGWDLARIPYDPHAWFEPLPPDPAVVAEGSGAMEEGYVRGWSGEIRSWSPASTLVPRYWQPVWASEEEVAGVTVLPLAVGFATGASDAVGRNRWSTFLMAPVGDPGRRWEGGAAWSWAGLGNPVLTASGEQRWEALGALRLEEEAGETRELFAVARERTVGLAAGATRPGFRRGASASLSIRGVRQDRFLLEEDGAEVADVVLARPTRDLGEGTLVVGVSTVRAHPFSISPQEGAGMTLRLRGRRDLSVADSLRGVPGLDGGYRDVVGVGRLFLPLPTSGFAPAVLAFRGSAGVASGSGVGSGHFSVGGSLFPVRGFSSGAVRGDGAWAAGSEIRVPLALLHRGWRTLPLHLDRLAGAAFVDAGGARWSGGSGGGDPEAGRWVTSVGGEMALHHTFLTRVPTLVRVGGAWPIRGGEGMRAHAGLGWAF